MEMDPHNNKSKRRYRDRLIPALTPGEVTGATHLSPPIRRWQRTLQVIRKDRCLLHLLLRRLHTGGDIFVRLFHVRVEDTLRRVVREELHKLLHYLNLPPQPPPDQTIKARYWLVFLNKVESPTFTTDLVRDENGDPIKAAIYDTYSQSIISPDCSLSSAKVRLTVLNAKFWENKGETWSRNEFNQSVLRERDGKGPILIGRSLTIQLENGFGTFGNIIFKDNSSWSNGVFRLGVMVEGEGEEGYLNGERVREGVSESFQVKDRRGKASQKPDQLELKHEVQCLKKVGKDRASLLQKNNIKTMEDFLWWYYNNEPELRKILCIKSESDKGWKSIVEHAMQCANEFHAKYNALNNSSQPRQALTHPIGRNMSLCTNGGSRVVSSGSSEPNPYENDIIEEPAIYGQLSSSCGFSSMNVLNEHISTSSVEHIVEAQHPLFHETNALVHPMERNMYLCTNGGPPVVGSGSSDPNPGENDIIEGDVYSYFPGLAQPEIIPDNLVPIEDLLPRSPSRSDSLDDFIASILNSECVGPEDQVPMEDHFLANTGNILQGPSRSDSFNPGLCEALVQDFIASMSNNVYVGPQTPRRKWKMKALVRSVTFVAVIRKRARIVPPANQMTVPAI